MAGHETNRASEVSRTIFSALHYLTAFTVILIFADMLTSNSLRLTGTAELMRQLAEFGNIPSNYTSISAETVKTSAQAIKEFMTGNSLVSNNVITMLLALNASLIFLHFFSRRTRHSITTEEVSTAETTGLEHTHVPSGSGHLKALVQNLKNMMLGAGNKKDNTTFNSTTLERIVHLNLDIETAAAIVKDLENNLTQSATELQVMAKSAMESGNRAISTSTEWNKQTKMLENQNSMNQKVQSILKGLKRTIKDIHHLIQETKQTELSLSNRTKNIETNVKELYERSEDGDQLVIDMHSNIDTCINDVRTASELVKQLSGKAREIVNIIDVIDDIAEQTNLLALNASIEAARAGEQGQGFAVVADEVRKLAVRSSSTTRNITHLLQTIQTEAESACSFLGKGETSITHTSSLFGRLGQHVASDRISITKCLGEVDSTQQSIKKLSVDFSGLTRESTAIDEFATDLTKLHIDITTQNNSWLTEIRNSSIATDRIARSLSRNHFKLEHLERLAISNVDIARDILKLLSQNIGFSGLIRGNIASSKRKTGYSDLGEAMRYVEMLETAVKKLEAAPSGTKLGKTNKIEPAVGKIAGDMHPLEKALFADGSSDSDINVKGA
jgi:methyl-accepting chemotaxis protein